MSSSFLSLYEGEGKGALHGEGPMIRLPSRGDVFNALGVGATFDLIVVGGSLTGVTVAREASLRGADVILIEPEYFGKQSLSWRESIALTHAKRPWTLLRSLRVLRSAADEFPHLVTSRSYRDGVPHGVMAQMASWLMRRRLQSEGSESYIPDVDERLLTREVALAARQEGALVLGAAAAAYVERGTDTGRFRVGIRDLLSGKVTEVAGRTLFVDPTCAQPLMSRLGTPIVRRTVPPVPHVSVVCRTEGSSLQGGYETLLLSTGVVVGLCELEPGIVEISLLGVEQTVGEQFVDDVVHHVCDVKGFRVVEEISRRRCGRQYGARAQVIHKGSLFLAEERIPWDVATISSRVVTKAVEVNVSHRVRRPLPGEWREGDREEFVLAAREKGISEVTIERVLRRWKGRVRYISQFELGFEEVCEGVLRGEIVLGVESDQVTSLEDLVFGSLALHTIPGWRASVPAIAEAVAATESFAPSESDVERSLAAMR
jgi:hypothetical protein